MGGLEQRKEVIMSDSDETTKLPKRTADTMSMAIAMSSPDGRMSKAAKKRAHDRLAEALFGEEGLSAVAPKLPPQPTKKEAMLAHAQRLRDLAAAGMKPRAYAKEAARLEAEAEALS